MSVTKQAVKMTAKENYIKVRLSQGVTKQEADPEAEAVGEAVTEALVMSQENLATKDDLGELATKEFVEKTVVNLATKESVDLLAEQQKTLATKESVELLRETVTEQSALLNKTWQAVTEISAKQMNFAAKSDVSDILANQKHFATKSDLNEILTSANVATKSYVDEAIAKQSKNIYRLVYSTVGSAVGIILTAMAISVTILKLDDNTGLTMEQLHQAILIMQSQQVQVQGNKVQVGQEEGQE